MQRENSAEDHSRSHDADEAVEMYVQAVSNNTLSRLRQLIPRWEAHFSAADAERRSANDSRNHDNDLADLA
ncbi:MAG TPA: hypothetical protein VGM81_20180 [Burkholderiaceae bacterium]|jgi:hypothetical protein